MLVAVLAGLSIVLGATCSASADAGHPIVLGANTTGITDDTGRALSSFAARAGVTPEIAMYYQDWNPHWSTALLNPRFTDPISADGSVPMVTWAPMLDTKNPVYQSKYAPKRIASGAFDHYIDRAAREAAAYGKPFFLRFAHEMNGSWSPWGAHVGKNRPRHYVRMWRHVVSIFRREGANNVRWVWSPNIYLTKNIAPFRRFYPGDRWVDFVALDGYNWGATRGSGWTSFRETFRSGYRAMRRLTHKPMMIGETASAEKGGNKSRWIRGIAPALDEMPAVRALIWFDRKKETDWRINSSRSAQEAFRNLAGSAQFSGDVDSLLAMDSTQ